MHLFQILNMDTYSYQMCIGNDVLNNIFNYLSIENIYNLEMKLK